LLPSWWLDCDDRVGVAADQGGAVLRGGMAMVTACGGELAADLVHQVVGVATSRPGCCCSRGRRGFAHQRRRGWRSWDGVLVAEAGVGLLHDRDQVLFCLRGRRMHAAPRGGGEVAIDADEGLAPLRARTHREVPSPGATTAWRIALALVWPSRRVESTAVAHVPWFTSSADGPW